MPAGPKGAQRAEGEQSRIRSDRSPILSLFVLALALEVATTWVAIGGTRIGLHQLGVFFDGHLYLEIARSFPLPYAAEGREYLGQAPGYPALLYLGRLLTGGALDWGWLALLGSWLPAALAAPVFYLVAKQTVPAPYVASLLFVAANPRWVSLGATPHPEPLAMLLSLACLCAFFRAATGWSAAWLSLAALARFPAILLGPSLACGVLLLRGDRRLSRWVWLSLPLVTLGLFQLYLALRVPDFPGILEAHSFWWDVRPTWPFAEILGNLRTLDRSAALPTLQLTFVTALAYTAAVVLGFRRGPRERWILPLWVGPILLFHVSLAGRVGAADFSRLAILAWPAALLSLVGFAHERLPPRLPAALRNGAAVALVLGSTALSFAFATRQIGVAVFGQRLRQPYLEEAMTRLDEDEPRWLDFRDMAEEAIRRRRAGPERPR